MILILAIALSEAVNGSPFRQVFGMLFLIYIAFSDTVIKKPANAGVKDTSSEKLVS